MFRAHDTIKQFQNGNINLRFDRTMIEEAQKDEILTLVPLLETLDCYFIGESYCLSNYETGHTVYNAYSDLVYIFAWSELEKLKQGKTVKLYARKPNKTDREILESEVY